MICQIILDCIRPVSYTHLDVYKRQTPWGEYEKILTGFTGRVVEICAQQGATVRKGDVIGYILRSDIFA